MIESKQEFIKTFLPYDIEDINYAQIDLDVSNLTDGDSDEPTPDRND